MAEEPQREAPVPSPHPSSGLEAGSSLLDLTPEKPLPARRRRSRVGPVQLKQHDFHQISRSPAGSSEPEREGVGVCAAELSVPVLHSTAPLYQKLQQFREVNGRSRVGGEKREKREAESVGGMDEEDPLPSPSLPPPPRSSSPAILSSVEEDGGGGGVAEGGENRYSDLVAVDVSEESFQRLTTCSRKKTRNLTRGGGRAKRDTAAPNIMDFFSSDLEMEEIAVAPLAAMPDPQPTEPSIDDALTLYHLVYR